MRPSGSNLQDSAAALRRAPQVHWTCLGRERAPARSLVSRNLHGPGGVSTCTVVSPLSSSGLRDPAAAICRIPLSLSGELPKYTARVLGENEPLHGASFPGTYTVLLPSSLLREVVPVLYASLAGHSHLCALPSRNGARRCGVSKTSATRPYLLKTNTMKTL